LAAFNIADILLSLIDSMHSFPYFTVIVEGYLSFEPLNRSLPLSPHSYARAKPRANRCFGAKSSKLTGRERVKCCFYICSVHARKLSHWRSCTVGGPWTLCFLINWFTCLKSLRTPALECAKSRLNSESHWLVNGSILRTKSFCKKELFSVTSL